MAMITKLLKNDIEQSLKMVILMIAFGLFFYSIIRDGYAGEQNNNQSDYEIHNFGSVQVIPYVDINENVIKLSDIFTNITHYNDAVILKAPNPGKSMILPAKWLQQLSNQYQLNWDYKTDLRDIKVSRASIEVPKEDILHVVENYFYDHYPDYDPNLTSVEFSSLLRAVHLEVNSNTDIIVESINISKVGSLVALVRIGDGSNMYETKIRGRVHRLAEIWTAKTKLKRGDIIGESDLEFSTVPVRLLHKAAVLDINDIIGKQVKTIIQPQSPILERSIQEPVLVNKKDIVTIVFKNKGLQLTMRGVSLDQGIKNQVIRVKNLQSKTVIEAIVVKKGMAIMPSIAG